MKPVHTARRGWKNTRTDAWPVGFDSCPACMDRRRRPPIQCHRSRYHGGASTGAGPLVETGWLSNGVAVGRPKRSYTSKITGGNPWLCGGYAFSWDWLIVPLESSTANRPARQLVQAHKYWRLKGLAIDLVLERKITPATGSSSTMKSWD